MMVCYYCVTFLCTIFPDFDLILHLKLFKKNQNRLVVFKIQFSYFYAEVVKNRGFDRNSEKFKNGHDSKLAMGIHLKMVQPNWQTILYSK